MFALGLGAASAISGQSKSEFKSAPRNLKINEIQVVGTHNSYSRGVEPTILSLADETLSALIENLLPSRTPAEQKQWREEHPNGVKVSEGLRYSHPPIPEQLDAGLRNLEIDVYYDPQGGRFSDPAAYRYFAAKGVKNIEPYDNSGMDKPGFKVFHIADFDVRSNHKTLEDALTTLRRWSKAHPNHVPIVIQLEAKESAMQAFPNPAQVLKFDEKAFADLDAEIFKFLGRDKIITPDQIRGKYKTLREAVLAQNWPTLDAARGKFMFLLLPAGGAAIYTKDRPSLEGRAMFMRSTPDDEFGAFLLMDNALVREEEIKKNVALGFMVRTRADIETLEAKTNDLTRAEAAFRSGAQVVSTDFYKPGNYYGTSYVVRLPGGGPARLNPISAPK